MTDSEDDQRLAIRIGAALRRAPYAWLVSTIAVFVVMLRALTDIAEEPGEGSVAIAIGVSVYTAYSVFAGSVLLPRVLTKAGPRRPSGDQTAVILWGSAGAPWLVGFAGTAAGGERWGMSVGLFGSIALLIFTARWLHRQARLER